MSNCCEPTRSHPGATATDVCPACEARGKPVELLTVKALLHEAALARLCPIPHRFCASPACPLVYFDESGQAFSTDDVRVPVWQKVPFGRRTVCYCFGENDTDMRRELHRTGTVQAVARVRANIDACRCACEVRNPSGVCCLGDLAQAVKQVAATLEDQLHETDARRGESSNPWRS